MFFTANSSGMVNSTIILDTWKYAWLPFLSKLNIGGPLGRKFRMISDLHSTHITDELLAVLHEAHGHQLFPPAHSSNWTSGLDVEINGKLKKASRADITIWESYLRKQDTSLRIEDFPHVVARAISNAVDESNIVKCFKQSSTWPIDPDIVLNKMPVSVRNQRITFADYTTKQTLPAPTLVQPSSLNPIEISIPPATPASKPTKVRRPDSDPTSNRDSKYHAKTFQNMNTINFELGSAFDLEAEREAVKNIQLLVETGLQPPKKGSRGKQLSNVTDLSSVYNKAGLEARKQALVQKDEEKKASNENLKKAKEMRALEVKKALTGANHEAKEAGKTLRTATRDTVKAGRELAKLQEKIVKAKKQLEALKREASKQSKSRTTSSRKLPHSSQKFCLAECTLKEDDVTWVQCTGKACRAKKGWYHQKCLGLTDEALAGLPEDWLCSPCLEGSSSDDEDEEQSDAKESADSNGVQEEDSEEGEQDIGTGEVGIGDEDDEGEGEGEGESSEEEGDEEERQESRVTEKGTTKEKTPPRRMQSALTPEGSDEDEGSEDQGDWRSQKGTILMCTIHTDIVYEFNFNLYRAKNRMIYQRATT